MNKKGVSDVVTTVLIIMLTVAAIGVIAGFVVPFVKNSLQKSTECINYQGFYTFDETFEYNCYQVSGENRKYALSIKTSAKSGLVNESDAFKIVFKTQSGETKSVDVKSRGQLVISDRSLVLYLPFEEGIGSKTYDKSSYGNNGTISGAAWTTGKYEKALDFDGVNAYVYINTNYGLKVGAMTLEAWVKPTRIDSTENIIIQGSTNEDGYYRLEIGSSNKTRTSFGNKTKWGPWAEGTTILQPNNWYYLVGIWDGSNIKIFVNGVLENSASWSGPNAIPGSTLIGRYRILGYNFPGRIDEVKIYNRALSAEEIKNEYESGRISIMGESSAELRVPGAGGIITYIYESPESYESAEVYPVLKSGRICGNEKDAIELKSCEKTIEG